jgi:hypothetical protein
MYVFCLVNATSSNCSFGTISLERRTTELVIWILNILMRLRIATGENGTVKLDIYSVVLVEKSILSCWRCCHRSTILLNWSRNSELVWDCVRHSLFDDTDTGQSLRELPERILKSKKFVGKLFVGELEDQT